MSEIYGSEKSSGSSENPFGILTIYYSWREQPDLDTGTSFLGRTVGYGHSGRFEVVPYMSFTGDDVEVGGYERVDINLGDAWAAGAIDGVANIYLAADWYPNADDDPETLPNPNPGSGPASVSVTYSLANGPVQEKTIFPGTGVTPAVTAVGDVVVSDNGTFVLN